MTLNRTELAIRLANGEKLKPVGYEGYCEFDSTYRISPFRLIDSSRNSYVVNMAMEWAWNYTEWETYKLLPSLEVDTKVIVWDNNSRRGKQKRYFSHFDDKDRICCYSAGTTSWSFLVDGPGPTPWDNYELVVEDNNSR